MLISPIINTFGWTYANWGSNPSSTPGLSVVPGISNAEGSWNQVASSSNISNEVWAMHVAVSGGNTSANQKDHLLDIGVDPAGGTSYVSILSNIVCGQSQAASTSSTQFYFPIKIPSGSSVAVRVQGNNSTAGTVSICIKFYGKPSNPELVFRGEYSETIGAITGSAGVSFTPGNAADGSWVSLGTTTRNLYHFNLCTGVANGTITAQYTWVDLAYGDATNKVIIVEKRMVGYYGTAEILAEAMNHHLLEGYKEVPSGSTLYVRGRCSTTPATGYHAVAVGIG